MSIFLIVVICVGSFVIVLLGIKIYTNLKKKIKEKKNSFLLKYGRNGILAEKYFKSFDLIQEDLQCDISLYAMQCCGNGYEKRHCRRFVNNREYSDPKCVNCKNCEQRIEVFKRAIKIWKNSVLNCNFCLATPKLLYGFLEDDFLAIDTAATFSEEIKTEIMNDVKVFKEYVEKEYKQMSDDIKVVNYEFPVCVSRSDLEKAIVEWKKYKENFMNVVDNDNIIKGSIEKKISEIDSIYNDFVQKNQLETSLDNLFLVPIQNWNSDYVINLMNFYNDNVRNNLDLMVDIFRKYHFLKKELLAILASSEIDVNRVMEIEQQVCECEYLNKKSDLNEIICLAYMKNV